MLDVRLMPSGLSDQERPRAFYHLRIGPDHIVYDSTNGKLWYDADGKSATAAVQFAVLVAVACTLTSADFLIA